MSAQIQPVSTGVPIKSLRLPIPTVLVVGNRDTTFAKKAWHTIKQAYTEQPVNFGPLPEKDVDHPEKVIIQKNRSRVEGPALYPFFLHDSGETQSISFQNSLRRIFYYFDVWAVISCGAAGTTEGLVRGLAPIDIPLFITVDSTLSDHSRFSPSFLQLIPNNTLQAQAILGKVRMLFDKLHPNKKSFEVFFDRRNDEYVVDLVNALSSYCREIERDISFSEISNPTRLKANNEPGILVCVGYYEMMKKLKKLANNHLIMSDGCYDDKVVRLLKFGNDNTYCWAHTLSEPADYAQDAYLSVCDIWRRVTMENRELSVRNIRLRQFLLLVRDALETRLPSRYKFIGESNQRGGYVVEDVPQPTPKLT